VSKVKNENHALVTDGSSGVSKVKGTKKTEGKIAVYLADFLSAATSSAAPAASADLARHDSARVSMTIAYQARYLHPPWDKGYAIRAFPVGPAKTDWLSCRRETSPDKAMPDDTIYGSANSCFV